jgi:dTDP-4-dehydrorhamnose reductase
MKILIFGTTGMLGHTLFNYLGQNNSDLNTFGLVRDESDFRLFTKRQAKKLISAKFDIRHEDIRNIIEKVEPNLVLNCIGLIKQDNKSKSFIDSISINSLLPHIFSKVCDDKKIRLIHFSTDCVFSGTKGNYSEKDTPDCNDVYGLTKLLGEVNNPNHLTLRTSIIGHELKKNLGLLEWFLNEKNEIKGFSNAIFSGLTTLEIAKFVKNFIIPEPNISGIYHLSSKPISKYNLLKMINDLYNVNHKITKFDEIMIDRSLNSNQLRKVTGYSPPEWDQMISEMKEWNKNYEKLL